MSAILRLLAFGRMPSRRARVASVLMLAFGAALLSFGSGYAASPIQPVSATTVDDGDGFIDTIVVSFSGPMDPTKTPLISTDPAAPGFGVAGYEIASINYKPSDATKLEIHLAQKELPDTAVTPHVWYVAGGNAKDPLDQELGAFDRDAVDGAGPALISVTAKDLGGLTLPNMFNAVNERLSLVFSEPIAFSGVDKMDRWVKAERLVSFTKPQNAGNGYCVDGTWPVSGTSHNFPQPDLAKSTSLDVVDVSGNTISITAKRDSHLPTSSSNWFWSVPKSDQWCKLGIDSQGATVVADAANNIANAQSIPQLVYPADIGVDAITTVDSAPADGKIDALSFDLDQNVVDSTLSGASVSISLDGTDATVDSIDSGTDGDDKFLVHFSTPAGVTWDGGARPTVTYSKPSDCSASSASGIKGNVPNAGYMACVGSLDTTATDGALAFLKAARTLDVDGDGLLDRIALTFSEKVVGGAAGWKVDDRQATAFTVDAVDQRLASLDFPEGTAGDTGTLPSIQYTSQGNGSGRVADYGANEIAAQTTNATADGAAPRIRTARVLDSNGDAKIDQVELAYSENIVDPASSAASIFSVDGTAASSFVAGTTNDNKLLVSYAPITGTGTKAVAYAGGGSPIADAAGNATGAQSFDAASVTDGAAPVGVVTISQGAPMSAGTKTVVVTYSELMSTTAAPTVKLNIGASQRDVFAEGAAGHTNGWITADPTKWEGTVDVTGADCLVSTGCAASVTADGASDPASNVQLSTATLTTEIDTVAPTAPLLGSFAATVADGETAPANTVNMFTDAFSFSGSFAAAEAEGGRLEIIIDGNKLSPAARSGVINGSATTATAATDFADHAALVAAVGEGAHALSLELCDDAANCTRSADPVLSINADYTPVNVTLTAPAGGNVVAGGSTLAITWDGDEAGAGFDHLELDYSTDDGATYAGTISHDRTLDGSFDWSVPVIDVANARVRAATVDANGNKGLDDTASSFSIDSTAPVVKILSPNASNPFVPAGGFSTIRWSVTDASVNRADNPIKIEHSTNGGSSWSQINGATYSKANDGEEAWNVPSGSGFTTLLRVTATDAIGKSRSVVSTKIARGVGGYVADRYGTVVPFGTASSDTNEMAIPKGYSVRGIAVRPDGTAGYRVLHQGAIYPFAVDGAPMPGKPSYIKLKGDLARDIVLRTNTSGYVLDARGRLNGFGCAPKATSSKAWSSDTARDVILLPNGRGGYVLDKYGLLYPFKVGSYAMPAKIRTTKLSTARAVSVVLRSNGKSGWVLDSSGRLYAFGGAPARRSSGVKSSAAAKSVLLVAQDSGYWVDGRGVLHAFGSAYGNPTRITLGTGRARGAAM